jgi:hypothetical protein
MFLSVPQPAICVPHPQSLPSDDEDDIGLTSISRPSTPLVRPGRLLLPQNDTALVSPSSPDLLDRVIFSPRTLTRSRTLPTVTTNTRVEEDLLDKLILEPDRVIKLRRWILGLAIGGSVYSLCPNPTESDYQWTLTSTLALWSPLYTHLSHYLMRRKKTCEPRCPSHPL